MENQKSGFRSVDEYIATFPQEIQALLKSVRATIKAAAPGAEERISYQMPTFVLNGYLVYFAAWKQHIGFYPVSSGVQEAFKAELARYASAKGSVRFPLDEPLPLELISKIVQYRVSENLNKVEVKVRKKKA
ncbi:MAG TPA: DUF1801 domain-containing protein [Chloroflexia bacterium]|jgi:uncharacterized protein YdhG (YjbR/CyaY superfamily)